MAKMSPDQLAAKWRAKYGASSESYKQGVQTTQKDPIQLAIQAAPRWLEGVQEAAAEGRFERGLQRSSKAKWQAACVEKGAANMATAAKLGESAVAAAEREIGPMRDAAVAGLPARGTYEQNKQRMNQMVDAMKSFKRRR